MSADEIVQGVDTAHGTALHVIVITIGPITGDGQEIAVVAELIIEGRDRGERDLWSSRRMGTAWGRVRTWPIGRLGPVSPFVSSRDHMPGSRRTIAWEPSRGQRNGAGQHRAVGRAVSTTPGGVETQSPGRRAGRTEPAVRRGRVRPGPGPRHPSPPARGRVDPPPPTSGSRLGAVEAVRPSPRAAYRTTRVGRNARRKGKVHAGSSIRMGKKSPFVPRRDRLEERRYVRDQADLIDHQPRGAGRHAARSAAGELSRSDSIRAGRPLGLRESLGSSQATSRREPEPHR